MIRLGVAGWDYDDWKGPVYPPDSPKRFDRLAYLCEYFDTIEINSTFYGPPSAKSAASWVRRTGSNPRFRFTAKLYQRFTHERDSAWSRTDVDQVMAGFAPLMDAGRLGCVLVQFPWSFRRTDVNREWLGDVVTAFREFPLAVEVRHSSWNVPEFYLSLAEFGVAAVNVDQPVFKQSITPDAKVTSPVGYVRLHGRNYDNWFRENAESHERYDYLYSKDELAGWLDRIHEVAKHARETWVIANNHWRGQAAVNAKMLEKMLDPASEPEIPDGLRHEFRDALESVGIRTSGDERG